MAKTVQTSARLRQPQRMGTAPGVRPCLALASRELEVARMLCDGKNRKEIALDLHVSFKTVGTYMSRIAAKLKVQSTVQVVLWMLKHRKVTLDELYCGVPECVCKCHCHVINKDFENPKAHFPSRAQKGGKGC